MTPKRIIVHHSATKDTGTLSWSAIHRYHTQNQGWSDIGYHAGCEYVRDDYIVILGRPEDEPGAHTKGMNTTSLGFCFVGNFDELEPSDRMLEVAARRWFVPVMKRHSIGFDALFGHRDFAPKTCPGTLFNMDRLRNAIRQAWAESEEE